MEAPHSSTTLSSRGCSWLKDGDGRNCEKLQIAPMRVPYFLTTGTLVAVLALAHVWRAVETEPELATEPWYVLITLIAVRPAK
jgi:hypothetical protein